MPTTHRALTTDDVDEHVRKHCFAAGTGGRVGIELEWLVVPVTGDGHCSPRSTGPAVTAATPLPGGSRISFEPGGQVELSSPVAPSLAAACTAMAADVDALGAAFTNHGMRLVGLGMDPVRPGRRVLDLPRYQAMEAYFDRLGPEGRRMMRSTASIQVNVDHGRPGRVRERWSLANAAGPTLAATFANSPLSAGRAAGMKSTRLANWWQLDPTRTRQPSGMDPDDYARYVLDARVMLVQVAPGQFETPRSALQFGRWVEQGHELGWPDQGDLDYHLTTLFPPVRPRGWLELRMLDALPDPWWRAATAIVTAVLEDDLAAERARRAVEGTEQLWVEAARYGLDHPDLAAAARECVRAGLDALGRLDVDDETISTAEAFAERYTERRRSPADDILDAWQQGVASPTWAWAI